MIPGPVCVFALLPAVPPVLDECQSVKGGGFLLTTAPRPSQLQFNSADT